MLKQFINNTTPVMINIRQNGDIPVPREFANKLKWKRYSMPGMACRRASAVPRKNRPGWPVLEPAINIPVPLWKFCRATGATTLFRKPSWNGYITAIVNISNSLENFHSPHYFQNVMVYARAYSFSVTNDYEPPSRFSHFRKRHPGLHGCGSCRHQWGD